MGGDGAPQVAVRGALEAITDLETPVLLVGPQKRLRRELGRFRFLPSGLELVDALSQFDVLYINCGSDAGSISGDLLADALVGFSRRRPD